jgi:hypothetical protein
MPTRKQRRRRTKDIRHDVRVFEVDGEGNEVPIAELRTREEPAKKASAKQGKQGKQGNNSRSRPAKVVPPPSWERAFKRGGLMGGLMLVAFIFVFKNGALVQRLGIGIFYGVAFIPLTYWIDRTAHRTYLRRIARQNEKT